MRFRRLATAVAVATVVLGLGTGVAAAHVTVSPSTAEQGSFTVLTIRVPNEKDDASTVKVSVKLPDDPPFAFVSVKPVPGWTADVQKQALTTPLTTDDGTVTEAVSTITWSGGAIEPGQFQEFEISVGPLPDVDTLTFPAIQTYSDGEEVAWIEVAAAGQPEPEHPAPQVSLTAASEDSDHHDSGATATTEATSDEQATSTSDSSHDDDSNGLAIAALVVGGIAIVLSVVALVRKPRPST